MPWVYKKAKGKTRAGQTGHWSEKTKMQVLRGYLESGTLRGTCASLGVPYLSAWEWTKKDWWKQAIAEIRADENIELDAKLSKLVKKSIDVVADRLENGDMVLDSKTGTIVRTPVKMKDTAQMMDKLIEKRRVIRNEPTKIVQTQGSVEDHLKLLANKFAELVNKPIKVLPEVIEGEIINEEILSGDSISRDAEREEMPDLPEELSS